MSFKMRDAIQENVGVSVKELEAREAAATETPKVETVVETKPAETPKKEEVYRPAVAKTPVNLRREPKLDAAVVCVLYPGNVVEVSYYDEHWYKLIHCGQECYVRREYILIKADE